MAVKVDSSGLSATHTTSSYRSWSFDWTAPSTGSGTVDVEIAVNTVNGNSAASGDAWTTSSITIPEPGLSNTAPTAANVYISDAPGPATAITKAYYDATLYANYDYSDQEGDSESGTEIRWLKGGISQAQYDDQPTSSERALHRRPVDDDGHPRRRDRHGDDRDIDQHG